MVFARARSLLAVAALLTSTAFGFDNGRTDNTVAYWGQNSYGATHGNDQGNWQKTLSFYCNDNSIDIIPIAFLHIFFSSGGLPSMDMSNICSSTGTVFPGTSLPNCQSLATDIKTCQSKGKLVTLSLGGATGLTTFSSDSQATQFADTIWNLFLGGSSSTRPFGSAVLDGVDLDVESGTGQYYPTFAKALKAKMDGSGRKYYLTAAPQCVFPDAALGGVINAVGFDHIYIQFYNNWCGLQNYDNANAWNFNVWDNWAKTTSPNKNVKIYIGAPASSTAASTGYVDVNRLGQIALATKSKYSSFGGVMYWDASQAYANNRFDKAIKSLISGGSNPPVTTPPPTSTPPPSGCGGVAAWSSSATYVGGDKVSFNGHLYQAKWWNTAESPAANTGVWSDLGSCFAKVAAPTAPVSAQPKPASVTAAVEKAKATPAPVKEAPEPKETVKETTEEEEAVGPNHINSRFFRN